MRLNQTHNEKLRDAIKGADKIQVHFVNRYLEISRMEALSLVNDADIEFTANIDTIPAYGTVVSFKAK